MAEARFYLKKSQEPLAGRPSVILLKYNRGKSRIQFSTGLSIEPRYWNEQTQRARKTLTGFSEFNGALERIAETVEALVNDCIGSGLPVSNESIRAKFHAAIGRQEQAKERAQTVLDAMVQYKEAHKQKFTHNYLKTVGTLQTHLSRFEQTNGKRLTFDEIDLGFYDSFTSYLLSIGHSTNTLSINIGRLKRFLQWASDAGLYKLDYHRHKKFKAKEVETDTFALTEPELMALFSLELPEGTARNVRDLFCFSAFTGLRFSDASTIRIEHIQKDTAGDWWFKKWIEKTKSYLEVPLIESAMAVLERHNFNLKFISSQKTNKYLKELCKLAGIDEPTLKTIYRGAVKDERTEPKYNLITYHCSRRTFATLCLEKGMRPEEVMKLTGHKTLKSFMRYVKVTSNVLKLSMHKAWQRPNQAMADVLIA